MGSRESVLPSGAKLAVTTAPFADAHALLKSLLKTHQGIPLADNPLQMDLASLKDALVAAATSEEVEAALFKCGERAAYEGVKVNRALFDDAKLGDQARADYYLIAWEIIQANCGPFFVQTFSALSARLKTPPVSPGSPSVQTTPSR